MNKILRISMIAVLALIANFSFAGVSTIDFTKLSVNTVSDVDVVGKYVFFISD